jgi:hypothetical protein
MRQSPVESNRCNETGKMPAPSLPPWSRERVRKTTGDDAALGAFTISVNQ